MQKVTIKMKYATLTGYIRQMSYTDGSPALVFLHDEGEDILSTNLGMYGLVPPPGCIHVKDVSEHEGLPDALVEAGVAQKLSPVRFGPFDSPGWLMTIVSPS